MSGALGIIFIFGCFTFLGLAMLIHRRLRLRHPSVFKELGSPHLFLNNNSSNSTAFEKFLRSSRPSALGDRVLYVLCRFALVYMFLLGACAVLLVVLTVLS